MRIDLNLEASADPAACNDWDDPLEDEAEVIGKNLFCTLLDQLKRY